VTAVAATECAISARHGQVPSGVVDRLLSGAIVLLVDVTYRREPALKPGQWSGCVLRIVSGGQLAGSNRGDAVTHTATTLAFMRIAVVGGHGQVARRLHPVLVRGGHVPVALVRRAGYREELEGQGAEVRQLDIERDDANAFGAAFEGCDAVVFAAGGGPDGNVERKRTVDLEGSLKSIAGAKKAELAAAIAVYATAKAGGGRVSDLLLRVLYKNVETKVGCGWPLERLGAALDP